MKLLQFLGKMDKSERGIADRITEHASNFIQTLVYTVRKEQGIILPRIRVTIWIPRENGETMLIERETHVNIADYEESFRNLKKK